MSGLREDVRAEVRPVGTRTHARRDNPAEQEVRLRGVRQGLVGREQPAGASGAMHRRSLQVRDVRQELRVQTHAAVAFGRAQAGQVSDGRGAERQKYATVFGRLMLLFLGAGVQMRRLLDELLVASGAAEAPEENA